MNVRAITAHLDAHGVEYALIGAFAMAAQGIVLSDARKTWRQVLDSTSSSG